MTVAYESFRKLVLDRSGLVLTADKDYLLKSRLEPLARKDGFLGLDQLLAKVGAEPSGPLAQRCIDAMATHESFFFRDATPFDQLRDVILPDLLAARAQSRTLRIWSAACSSGQEPYSLAMLLMEEQHRMRGWRIDILATDMSLPILERARTGLYSDFEVRRGLSDARLARWFTRAGEGWSLSPQVRSMVRFAPHNLLAGTNGLGPFDLIFCRNVLIYFDREHKRAALSQIAKATEPHGALVLGSAETVVGLDSAFAPMVGLRGVFKPGG
ncbi:CheR family methyltransferase [Brevundimonas bullata]